MKKSISIQSTLDNITHIEKLVDEISEQCKLSSDIYGKILIATIEAVNNSITHGNKYDISKTVDVAFQINDSSIHIYVKDQGPGFNYHDIPDPTRPENIENVSGRGVFLMRNLADSIEFDDNGSKVELIFHI
ncbi:MAG: ATP-binding protein [Tenuifilaceae bacterium]|jgi:serine/threonine-protein kinase RsbW|uniref:ATP-binding protein n=1 Tax=Perlabentimonas gracilis TaxID=2715279 RepID=UPI00140D7F5B|nr:ATP-binding protein [Perlabentimonas gracilis]MDX9770121.1 ATP-binding protein [Tenuifilaceae bacterium]NHB68557.1 ATP-binding protein [Perlabentimonas gracilis]